MRKLWPRSLPSWILIIVVAALAAAQVATLLSVNEEIVRANRSTDLFRLGDRTLALGRELQHKPVAERQDFLDSIKGTTVSGEIDKAPAITSVVAADDELAEMEDLLMARLATEGIQDLRIDRRQAPQASGRMPADDPAEPESTSEVARRLSDVSSTLATSGRFLVAIQLADGSWFNFSVPQSPPPALFGQRGWPVYAAISAIVLALCLWAVIQLTAPYRKLERGVGRISQDLNTPPLAETGSREARATIRAVNQMQARLQEYVAERENLAAALAHDLRTPLTRMKLRCELMRASKDKQQLQSDIEDLQAIIASVIDFASMTQAEEKPSKVDVVSLLETICDNFPAARLTAETEALHRLVVMAQPVKLQRCLRNLVENAIRYGGIAMASVRPATDEVSIWIEDNGPGIPEDQLERVLKPFVRLETSRNQAFGGTGLGLAIAHEAARAQGGSLHLENRPEGGLRAVVTLPRLVSA